MNGSFREKGSRCHERKSSGPDVTGRDCMGDIDWPCARLDTQDDAFHRADEPVLRAEICGQGDYAHEGILFAESGIETNIIAQMAKAERKVIVITGATRGLGRAMVDEFIWHGHSVLGCGRSEEQVEALSKTYGPPHHFAAVDVTDDLAVKRWVASCVDHAGAPDLLLNNAAVINRSAPLWGISAAEFSEIIDINIKGVTNVIRHFVPDMMERGKGVIVNWSSGWGRSTSPEVAPYCATKWAIEGLTQALAQELPEGLTAVALNPGIINTEMLRSCLGGSAASYPSPDEWAKQAVPYLLSIGSRHSGQQLTVPGTHT